MKTKKVVIGTMAAAIFSMSLSALPVTFAAGETVQISVGSKEVSPGEEFTVDVMLSDIPATGVQACDFTINYDTSLINITSVKAGALTETGASEADSTSSVAPVFDSYILDDEGKVNLSWSTSLEDSKYWLNGSGVFCTITGTASANAANGSKADLKITATGRDTYPDSGSANNLITMGYTNGSEAIRYDVTKVDGVISIGVPVTTTVPPTTEVGEVEVTKYGDADCNGEVEINDAVLIMSYVGNRATNPITPQGLTNADVYSRGDGISNMDALAVQKLLAQIVEELPES